MSRTYKPFSGPFAPMLTEFLAQKRALGYQYLSGYWVFRKFDSFSMDYDVVDYALTKEIVEDGDKNSLTKAMFIGRTVFCTYSNSLNFW